ncbi:hypothetical protein [Mahella australiensis]|uniref:Uncharacterized protein n=1 Tax=Mahella australiensis (strain DSM 15567 / CIP 107919 / 50-1 BON) TaxID=697281 RepID=F3ZYW5_MAHA5|nr:hypothetical protein [Mahella australiensis]AEE95710.1 hypothetical protein Mahau_0497 [Mahella australiensis 50-1 BON]
MKLTVLSIAIRAVPEAFIMIWVGLRLMGIKFDMKSLIHAALLQGIVNFAVRAFLPLSFGAHTLILLFSYIAIICLLLHLDLNKTMNVIFAGFISSGIAELITNPLIELFGTSMEALENSTLLQLLYGLPSLMIMLAIGWFGGNYMDKVRKQRIIKDRHMTEEG